ncbi:MAG: penicillin acylase family protein [Alphaproteobacteria bacterium]
MFRRRRSPSRHILRVFAVLALILLMGAGAIFLWLRSGLPQMEGTIETEDVDDPVTIVRDAHAIPHIRAESASDAYFALGFVHAQDRLWQMEAMRRVGAGRLSEVVGARAIELDRMMRTLGLYRLAEESYATLPPDVRDALDSYADGVNAFLETRRGALPPEFLLLGYTPEPWQPADSLVWGKLMEMQLSVDWRSELLRARLLPKLGRERIDALWPADADSAPTTLAASDRGPALALPWSIPKGLDGMFGGGASNAWVVDGRHTATAKPILANDPHLDPSLPNQWYLVHMSAPDLEVTGASAPGVPFVILGHNGRIAWGMTSSQSDVEDLFIEHLSPDDPEMYMTPDGPRLFETREERIRVKDGDDIVITVRSTRHGPVISDALTPQRRPSPDVILSLATSYLAPEDTTATAIYRLNRARNWQDFTDALRSFNALQQFIMYGDVEGNIGFYAPGHVPIRRASDGFLPGDGSGDAADWTGFIPFDALPHDLNPASGRLINANNRPVGRGYPYYLARFWEDPYRARRIEQRLAASASHTLDESAALQGDTLSLMAQDVLPALLALLDPNDEAVRAVGERLRAWDGTMAEDRPEPLLFAAWIRALNRRLLGDALASDLPHYGVMGGDALTIALGPASPWCGANRMSCADQVTVSLKEALAGLAARFGADIDRWQWGAAHTVRFRHRLFEHIPPLGRWLGIELPLAGDTYTLLRAVPTLMAEEDPYRAIHIASMRAIYDLADLNRSRFILPTGQSGHPFSRHYRDMAPLWHGLDYVTIPRSAGESEGGRVLTLKPTPTP